MNPLFGECLVDWQEEYKLLKLAVRSSFKPEFLISGSPYGTQRRRIVPTNEFETARFEFAAQKYNLIKENDDLNGLDQKDSATKKEFSQIGLFSQSKYGTSCDNNRGNGASVYLSLLKAPHFEPYKQGVATIDNDEPRPDVVDQGFHRIPWSIKLFTQTETIVDVVNFANEYNTPIISCKSPNKIKNLSFLSVKPGNVRLEWMKLQEPIIKEVEDQFYRPGPTESAVVLRLVEYEGKDTECEIEFNELMVMKAFAVDMLERIQKKIKITE